LEHRTSHLNPSLITILGPTASGKTSLAVALAARIDAEIISADSRQLYRGMTIGTGKDLNDYTVDGRTIAHHLIDICDPGYRYNVCEYQRDFHRALSDIRARRRRAILCGGTGLYIEAVLKGYRFPGATLYEPVPSLVIGLSIDRECRRRNITLRLRQRIEEGMIEEVQALLRNGTSADDLIYYGLEYRFITLHLLGKLTFDEMFTQLEIAIHQFAKRQMTWFRGMERRGFHIHWIDAERSPDDKLAEACAMIPDESAS
jgi:tRNA dimethylallyltransferase